MNTELASGTAAERADHALFDETLVCSEEMPARFRRVELSENARLRALERAESLLRVIALVEENEAAPSDSEDRGALDLGLQRVETKLNLVLDLLGTLLRQHLELPATVAVQWSRRGVRIDALDQADTEAFAGDEAAAGLLSLYPLPWLPQPLELPVTVVHREATRLWLRLPEVPGGFQAALERHLFRRHRRAIALSRRGR